MPDKFEIVISKRIDEHGYRWRIGNETGVISDAAAELLHAVVLKKCQKLTEAINPTESQPVAADPPPARWVVKPWHPELAYPTDEDAVAWYAQDTVLGYCTAPSRDLEGVETEVRRRNREDANQAGILIRDDGTPMPIGQHLREEGSE